MMTKNKLERNNIGPTFRCSTEALEIKALHRIVKLIDTAVHLDTVLSAVLKVLHDTLRMERATLALLDEEQERLTIRASYGLSIEEEQRGIYNLDEGIYGQVFRTGSPFIVPDVHSEPLFLNRTGARQMFSKTKISFIGVPVLLGEKPVGVLSVDRLFGEEVSLEEDVFFLTVLATLIAQFLSLNQAIRRDRQKLVQENQSLKARLHSRHKKHYIIGQCKAMQEVFWSIERVAPSQASVLLLGESGTGKELAAQAIHEASPRRDKTFVKINCAALPETLLESELFGHEKGAFTGADGTRAGRFELADKGTLFLDEIGEMPLVLQAKLLRVLQEQQFERLGSNQTRKVDVRIIAATNVSLEKAVADGTFRNDLYYRLNVVPVVLPPLRKRKEDIPILLDYFLKASNKRNNKNVHMSREFLDLLIDYNWPGNVRELQNLMERLVILSTGDILSLSDLPEYFLEPPTEPKELEEPEGMKPSRAEQITNNQDVTPSTPRSLKDLEREQVEAALCRHGWVQARAARELGLTQRQIGYRIKKFNLKRPVYLI
ncbi:MAG: nif-specific transcriptional activator NifA [Candidatus Electrothrix gigas]